MPRLAGIFLAAALTLLCAGSARAVTLQPLGEFDEPIYVTSEPGDPSRLFVVERKGKVHLLDGEEKTLFTNLEGVVGCGGGCVGERGLLSIALAPDFEDSGRLYVDYAHDVTGTIHVEEMTAAGPDHETAGPATLEPLLEIPHPTKANHNGGQLQFGPDGNLYVSTGDGGGRDDELENAQDLDSLLGKILRIQPDPSAPSNFKVPADNPFVGVPGADEIWSYGLRNPFRFSFDKTTGAMLIGDVGQEAREEVDHATAPLFGAGANYGWSCREGLIAGPAEDPACDGTDAADFVDPVFDYPHLDPRDGGAFGCAILGGYVAREPTLTELSGRYVYGDLCTGAIRSLDLVAPFSSDRAEDLVVPELNSFGEDAAGRLYAVSGDGPVFRILAAPLVAPPILAQPRTLPFVGIKAISRPLKRGGRATITAYVSPCLRSRATATVVRLRLGQRRLGSKHLSRACTATFHPAIRRRSKLWAQVIEDDAYLAAESRRLTIKPRLRRPS